MTRQRDGDDRTDVPGTVVAIERQHVRARLRRIAVDSRALAAAIESEFGPDFDGARWTAAFRSDLPEDVNRVASVMSAFERIVNGLVETARSGLVAAGLAPTRRASTTVRADLELVHADGGLTAGQLELLVGLNRTRNQLQHVYIDVSADDARAAVRRLRSSLAAIVRTLNAWLKCHAVGV